MKLHAPVFIKSVAWTSLLVSAALGASSENFSIPASVINIGGGERTSVGFRVLDSVVGLETTPMQSANFRAAPGFQAVAKLPPRRVTDLQAKSGESEGTVVLTWTAPGDDGSVGTAATYLVRVTSAGPITTDAGFDQAAVVPNPPAPAPAGTVQSLTTTGLQRGTTYYFDLKTVGTDGLVSDLSNSPNARASFGPVVRINEVAPAETASADRIELFVVDSSTNMQNWTIRARTSSAGFTTKTVTAALTVVAGDFIIVHSEAGTDETDTTGRGANGVWDLFGMGGLIATDNAITLKNAFGTIIDFMAFADQDDTFNATVKSDMEVAAAAGHWKLMVAGNANQFDAPNTRSITAGKSIARGSDAGDRDNSKFDWAFATTKTIGATNGALRTDPGTGTASITPGSVTAGATTSYALTYVSNLVGDDARLMMTIDVPSGWTAPQTANPTLPGFTTTNEPFPTGFKISVVTGIPGIVGRIIVPAPSGGFSISNSSMVVEYRQATAPGTAGVSTFTVASDNVGTSVGPIATSPTVTRTGGGGSGAPRMARQGPSLGVPIDAISVGPNVVRGGVPASLWFYADWPQWTARVCLLSAAGERICEGDSDGSGSAGALAFERGAGLSARLGARSLAGAPDLAPAYIHRAVWNGRSADGAPVASGVYLMDFEITNSETGERHRVIRKLIIIR